MQSIAAKELPDLLHLVRLREPAERLEVQDLHAARMGENVMASSNPFREAEAKKEQPK